MATQRSADHVPLPPRPPRFEAPAVIQSGRWRESFYAPTQPVFADEAPGAAEQDGDPLEVLAGTVAFQRVRPLLLEGPGYSDGARGGHPALVPLRC